MTIGDIKAPAASGSAAADYNPKVMDKWSAVQEKPEAKKAAAKPEPKADTVAVKTGDNGDKAAKPEAAVTAPLAEDKAPAKAKTYKPAKTAPELNDLGFDTSASTTTEAKPKTIVTDDQPAKVADGGDGTATSKTEDKPVLADKAGELLGKDDKKLTNDEAKVKKILAGIQDGNIDLDNLTDEEKKLLAKFLLGEEDTKEIPKSFSSDLNRAVPSNIASSSTRLPSESCSSSGSCGGSSSQPYRGNLSSGRRGQIASAPKLGGWARNNSIGSDSGSIPRSNFTPSVPLEKIGVNTNIPEKAAEALHKYGNTFLAYEVNNGNLADKEAVASVLLRRLIHYANTKPEATAEDLIKLVAKGWNPHDKPTYEAIYNSVANKIASTAKDHGEEAIANVLKLDHKSPAGKTVWESGATEFYHPRGMKGGKEPKYYANVQNKGLLAKGAESGLKYDMGFGRDGARYTASA